MTKLSVTCGLLMYLAPSGASAVCIAVPFNEQLKAADAVFIATLVSGRLVDAPETLVERRRYITEFSFVVREVLKGSAGNTRVIYTTGLYDDPTDGRMFHYAEATRLSIGQSVLVLANGNEDVEVSLCSGSRLVTTEILRDAHSALEF